MSTGDTTTQAATTCTPATKPQKPSKPQKPARKRKSTPAPKTKITLAEEPTFGLIVDPKQYQHVGGGFVYEMILQHPRDPSCTQYRYIGQKSWHGGSDWRRYQSSGIKVHERLQMGFKASYRIIAYCTSPNELTRLEALHIAKSWSTEALRDISLNFGICNNGFKYSRYKYCKKYLHVIDKRY